MGPRDRWSRVEMLCHAAREREGTARVAFLDAECLGDGELRREVESLLAQQTLAGDFLDQPAMVTAAHVLYESGSHDLSGRRMGDYELLAPLGAGAMGDVYRARDIRLGREVALKILPDAFSHEPDRVARFRREARVLAALNHPHICTIHGIGQADPPGSQHFIVMEKLDGATLQHLITTRQAEEKTVLGLAVQLADALDAAHDKAIVHRDIKPANIFVTTRGDAKILDFGVAKLVRRAAESAVETSLSSGEEFVTGPGRVLGTIAYMSPEQARGLELDGRSDLFSLGVILYETVTRTLPFHGDTLAVMFEAILNRAPIPPSQINSDVSPGFERIITRLLVKDRDSRYQTAADVREDLKRLQREDRSMPTAPAPVTERDTILLAEFANTTGEALFDGTLTQALAVKLEESPYLNIASDDRVQHTLQLMGLPADERLTAAVSREICQRQGIKAMVTGSIANLGSQYVITLTAVNCQDGDSIARAQTTAASKEEVLSALGAASIRLRGKLGESLSSIQRFDMPLEDVTTSSLGALKAYSRACSFRAAGREQEAVPHLKHAIDLDPDFALAHAILGFAYRNLGELSLRDHHVTQAYQRRSRVTERERLFITGTYHKAVTGDLLKEFETLTLLQQTYPRYSATFSMLGHYYDKLGQFERAADLFEETGRLTPGASPLTNLADAYCNLNRLDEAKTVLEQAAAHQPEYTVIHGLRAQIAHVEHDDATKRRELDWLTVNDLRSALGIQAWGASCAGELRVARSFVVKLAELEMRGGLFESAALTWLGLAEVESACGLAEAARRDALAALKLAGSRDVAYQAARILATSGFYEEAQPLVEQCLNEYPPTHTLAKAVYIPAIHAALNLTQGNASAAVELLESAEPYDAGDYGVLHLRASAYLAANRPSQAITEFQKVIDGAHVVSCYGAIALLGRARAVKRMGEVAKSRAMYQHFLTAWKNADAELPLLVAARGEADSLGCAP